MSAVTPPVRTSTGSEFLLGLKLLGRGFGMYAKYPGQLLLGLIPAVIAFLILLAAFVVLVVFLGDLGAWTTNWFAEEWSTDARNAARLLAQAAIAVGAIWLAVVTYTSLTLIIGDPFYEKISEQIEHRLGASNYPDLPWYRTLPRNAMDSVRVIGTQLVLSIPVLLLGFVPFAGQLLAPIVGLLIGGWLLSVDLTGIPFNRRGTFLRERRKVLRQHRALALGFGIPVAALSLVPFANILVIPAAIAGGTLLTRYVHGERI
ncbi:EI24 domain-containing protein [Cryptosporangium aurantiacum]|uniref:CysZ protein n=1 Tax=Cryptosporangium aurantiacum TaxID=134849 RepID=A0A1M7RLC4_9ACTN|nr:EI24 domain-containing protein [Cryptosporangium aurantiacum]SHN46966.1 CysZ protein [Cryptosporangium aurantiacum]